MIDTGTFPLANFPHFAGLSPAEASICLDTFCQRATFAGLIVTEVNPDHDPDGVLVGALMDTLVHALTPVGAQGRLTSDHDPDEPAAEWATQAAAPPDQTTRAEPVASTGGPSIPQ